MKKNIITLLTLTFALIIGTTYGQVTNGLVAKYSFNNGNANDEVGTNNGTVHGAVLTTDRFGNSNKAYKFTNGEYITLPDASVLKSTSMTVSLWVKIDGYNPAPTSENFIYTIINSSTNAYFGTFGMLVNTSNGKYFSVSQNGPSESKFGYSLNPNNATWQHYVLSSDYDSLRMYIDGIKQWSIYKGFNSTFTSDSIYIGVSGNTTYHGNLNGSVDDIRVYNRVLSSLEIDSLFNEPNPVTTSKSDIVVANNSIGVYPNPTNHQINFSVYTNVQLTNLTGQIIADSKNVNTLDLSSQPAGIYFLTFTDDNGQVIQRSKIVKE